MIDALLRIALKVAYRGLQVWAWLVHPTVRGAFVAVWFDGELLLVKNTYRDGTTLPSGRVGRNEEMRAAAQRELAEEVGIVVDANELEPACEFEAEFENRHEHVAFFEWHPVVRPAVRIDNREVGWAAFVPEPALEHEPLLAHVLRYLMIRRQNRG